MLGIHEQLLVPIYLKFFFLLLLKAYSHHTGYSYYNFTIIDSKVYLLLGIFYSLLLRNGFQSKVYASIESQKIHRTGDFVGNSSNRHQTHRKEAEFYRRCFPCLARVIFRKVKMLLKIFIYLGKSIQEFLKDSLEAKV